MMMLHWSATHKKAFSASWTDFRKHVTTTSIKKTEVMAQDAEIPPSIYIDGSNLSVVDNFKYLGSTISSNLSLDVEINARIGKGVCKRDMKSAAIDIESWELMVKDHSTWWHVVKEGIKCAENT